MAFINRTAQYDYEFLDKYTAGIQLVGSEVKALRQGKCSLVNSFAVFINGELFTKQVHISEYDSARDNHEPMRMRKLLLNKGELRRLERGLETKGNTIIIHKIFLNDKGVFKASVALARGKKEYQKRESIKNKDIQRDTNRILKNQN